MPVIKARFISAYLVLGMTLLRHTAEASTLHSFANQREPLAHERRYLGDFKFLDRLLAASSLAPIRQCPRGPAGRPRRRRLQASMSNAKSVWEHRIACLPTRSNRSPRIVIGIDSHYNCGRAKSTRRPTHNRSLSHGYRWQALADVSGNRPLTIPNRPPTPMVMAHPPGSKLSIIHITGHYLMVIDCKRSQMFLEIVH